jgi:hypothetical protein
MPSSTETVDAKRIMTARTAATAMSLIGLYLRSSVEAIGSMRAVNRGPHPALRAKNAIEVLKQERWSVPPTRFELPLLDPQVLSELRVVPPHVLDEALCIPAADEGLDGFAKRVVRTERSSRTTFTISTTGSRDLPKTWAVELVSAGGD